MRYWYIDSDNYITFMLLDKGYYDYDYEKTDPVGPVVNWEDTIKSEEEVADMLSIFGMGPKVNKPRNINNSK